MSDPVKGLIKGLDYTGITIIYFCHDGQGNFVMNFRGPKCRDENYRWDTGGGGLEFGDTVENTLRKEIKEEFRADVLKFEFLGFREFFRMQAGKQTHWLALDFKVLVDRAQVENSEPHKFTEIGWFTLDTVPSPTHSQFPAFVAKNRAKFEER